MPKKKDPSAPQTVAAGPAPAAPAGTPAAPSPLKAEEQRFLGRVSRFLFGIQSQELRERARREGYTDAEHGEGWRLFILASGSHLPFDQILEHAHKKERPDVVERMRRLREIDTFENTWFPRTRAIIRRVVPRAEREAFAAAFFLDLEQQPLGPTVVGSVSTYLERVERLETSKEPAAQQVRQTLAERGLDAAAVTKMKGLLGEVRQGGEEPAPASEAVDAGQAQVEQREALEDLRDWYHDWATTLRAVFTPREQIGLGLLRLRRGTRAEEDMEDEGEALEDGTGAMAAAGEAGGTPGAPAVLAAGEAAVPTGEVKGAGPARGTRQR